MISTTTVNVSHVPLPHEPTRLAVIHNEAGSNGPTTTTEQKVLEDQDVIAMDAEYNISGMPAHPIVIDRGEGAYLYTCDGRQYLDLLSGFSAVNQGHCHPRIVQAVVEQSKRLMLPGRAVHTHQQAIMCKKMCQLFGFDVAAATNSGSEAVDLVVKLARKWGYSSKGIPSGEALILTAQANYHGRVMTSLSGSRNPYIREDCGPFTPGIGPDVTGDIVRFGSVDDLATAFHKYGHRIAAFMIETIQGNSGCIVPPPGYLQAVRALCSQYNVLWIADEIQCGLGRTGYLAAYQAEPVKPDMVLLGKGLVGGAYSAGMVLGSKEVMRCYKEGQHGSTFAGNPLVSAAIIAAVDVILDEKLCERAKQLGPKIKTRLQSMRSPYLASVHGRGMLFSVFVNETHPQGRVTAKRLTNLLLRRGILTYAYANKIRFGPPLVILEDALWGCIDAIDQALVDLETIEEEL